MSRTPVILVGLPSTHPAIPEEMRSKVKVMLDKISTDMANDAPDLDFHFVAISPEDPISEFHAALKKYNAKGVVIGNGVRSAQPLTVWFEQLVNAIRETTPDAKILFNTIPTDTIDAIRRWFPGPKTA
ncbi:hypothetical protein DFJ77DRAFT_538042 [Powellomyces hirtus]|nr:hypothetical protein DFJ77DRAFT_538042 [Powellomyces hirtus]